MANLYDYLPGISRSIEGITANLAQFKAMDMERQKMVFDYAINRAQIRAENRRYLGEKKFRDEEAAFNRKMKQEDLALRKKSAGLYEEMVKENIESQNLNQQEARERLKYLPGQLDLERQISLGQLDAQKINKMIKGWQFSKMQEADQAQKALNEIANKAYDYNTKLTESRNKLITKLQKQKIEKESLPSYIETGLTYLKNWPKGLGKDVKAAKEELAKRYKKRVLTKTMKEAPGLLFHDDAMKRRQQFESDVDKIMKQYGVKNYNKQQISEALSGQFPLLLNVPPVPMLEEDTMYNWMIGGGLGMDLLSQYNLENMDEASGSIYDIYFGNGGLKTQLPQTLNNELNLQLPKQLQ